MPAKSAPEAPSPEIDLARLPRHVAVIMDGNRRWARSRGLPRLAGHKAGVDSVHEIVRASSDLGVEVLTLYSFSTENWLRSQEEVGELMKLLSWALRQAFKDLKKNNVRLRLSGRIEGLPLPVRQELQRAVGDLAANTGLILNLALNYGARQEIVDAVNRLIAAGAQKVTEDDITRSLYTAGLPDPDLVIRTSGEQRLSNFLLWQVAYAEIYVTPVFWPEFRRPHLLEAIAEFQRRERRLGT